MGASLGTRTPSQFLRHDSNCSESCGRGQPHGGGNTRERALGRAGGEGCARMLMGRVAPVVTGALKEG